MAFFCFYNISTFPCLEKYFLICRSNPLPLSLSFFFCLNPEFAFATLLLVLFSGLGTPGGSVLKNTPVQESQQMQVRSLGQENPLEEEMATHSSILAWKIPWTEETGGLQSRESQSIGQDLATEHF